MWKLEHRIAADRRSLRYASDISDAEWALVAPLIPPARRGGRRRSIDERGVLNAIFCGLATGCQWQALPKDLPPKSTAHFYLCGGIGTARWSASTRRSMGRCARRRDAKRARRRRFDSQSSKAAQKGALRSTHRASMRARKSRAASAISSLTRSAFCSA